MHGNQRDSEATSQRDVRPPRHSCPNLVVTLLLLSVATAVSGPACQSGRGTLGQDAAAGMGGAPATGGAAGQGGSSSPDSGSEACPTVATSGAACSTPGQSCSFTTTTCGPSRCGGPGPFPGQCSCSSAKHWECSFWECFNECPGPSDTGGASGSGWGVGGRGGAGGTGGTGAGGMGPSGLGGMGGTNPGGGGNGGAPLAGCFEIFPSLTNEASDASPVMYHTNPLELNLGSVQVGTTAMVHVSYFNFCSDMNATLLGVDLTETPTPGSAGPSFAVTGKTPAIGGAIWRDGGLDVTFTPTTPGVHDAIVRYRVTHGDYVTHIKGGR